MITETQLRSQGYTETQRTAEVVTYERIRPFVERFFKGLLATLCTITVIPLFFMGRAVKQMWAEAFSPVDRKIIEVAKGILSASPLAEGETAALPPPSPLLKPSLPSSISTSHPPLADRSPPSTAAGGAGASSSVGITDAQLPSSIPKSPESGLPTAEVPSSSRITSIYRRPLAARSSASTAAGGAGAASSVVAPAERKERIICLNPSAAALAKDSSVVYASLPKRPPEEIGPLDVINRLCARLMTDKNEVHKQMSAVKQELDLLLKGYVQRSSKLPESYKNEFKELPSFEERLEYLVIDDPDSRRIIEQIIAAFERIEKQQQSMDTGYSPRGLLEVGEALKHCLNNNLFTAYQKGLDEGRFLVINTDEFQYPLTQIDFARTSGRDEVELEEDLVFLIYLNRCPSLAKADIDSRFDGELTRVEGILNSKGVLSSEDKETLDSLRTNMNFYRAENSLLGKRVIARLEESLNSDFKALIDDREMSAADKLNKIFEEFYPKYFPESFPVLQELSQSLERGCFELLMSGIDLSSVSKDLRDAFLEHLQDAELSIRSHRSGRSESSVESRFLKIAKENPEYFRHLRRLTLGSDDVAGYYLYAFLVSPEARLTFPNLKELQLNKDQLFTHDDPSQSGTTHLLKIIQNIPTLKSVKLQSVTSMLQRSKPVNIDYDALKSKFPPALRAEVNLDIKPIRFQNNCFFYEAIITIGERAE